MTFQLSEKQVLVIEDDPDINQLIVMNLQDLGLNVQSSHNGQQGYELACERAFDLVVLDSMLPDLEGIEICRLLSTRQPALPIVMLTAKSAELDRVVGLEVGADDYMTKPFSVRELQARVKTHLRRVDRLLAQYQKDPKVDQSQLVFGDLTIWPSQRKVMMCEHTIELTQTEFDLLTLMAKHPGTVFSRAELLDKVWGYQHRGYEHTVNSHINRLRQKLHSQSSDVQYVQTVWGVGYKFASAV